LSRPEGKTRRLSQDVEIPSLTLSRRKGIRPHPPKLTRQLPTNSQENSDDDVETEDFDDEAYVTV
jgi:hypothetical protein